jgi:hypothetical protein
VLPRLALAPSSRVTRTHSHSSSHYGCGLLAKTEEGKTGMKKGIKGKLNSGSKLMQPCSCYTGCCMTAQRVTQQDHLKLAGTHMADDQTDC